MLLGLQLWAATGLGSLLFNPIFERIKIIKNMGFKAQLLTI